jgi:Ca-activated chloride channel family protein
MRIFFILLCSFILAFIFIFKGSWNELWISNDQKGYQLFTEKKYQEASRIFEDRSYKGASFFKEGAFKKAKNMYITQSHKEGRYNLGNTYVMLGKYQEAIDAYTLALKIDPSFIKARENRHLATIRLQMKEVENDGKQGVGALGADEVVYDNKEKKGVDTLEEESIHKSSNTHWLDRIQTSPKAFLKNKFSYQYQMKASKNVP